MEEYYTLEIGIRNNGRIVIQTDYSPSELYNAYDTNGKVDLGNVVIDVSDIQYIITLD